MTQITGFKSTDIETRTKVSPSTVNPVQYKRQGPDNISWTSAYEVTSGTLASGSTVSTLSITGIESSARVGDIIILDSRVLSVTEVSTNQVTLGQPLAVAPSAGTAYSLRRYTPPLTSSDGTMHVQGSASGKFASQAVAIAGSVAECPFSAADGYRTVNAMISSPITGLFGVFEGSQDGGATWVAVEVVRYVAAAGSPPEVFPSTSFYVTSPAQWDVIEFDLLQYPKFRYFGGGDGTITFYASSDGSGPLAKMLRKQILLRDSAGNALTSATTAPAGTERGLHVRQVGSVTVGSSALPTGAATEATLDSAKTLLGTIDSKITTCDTDSVTISKITGGASSTVTQVAASASSVTLLSANSARKEAEFYNDSTYVCYLKKGTGASTSSCTTQVLPGGYYKILPGDYAGEVTGIWPTASGNMLVTEVEA